MHFHLSKIGQITNAQIETKNLTLFIGKNGSGKTYATSSIWSLINFIKETAPKKEVIRCPQFDKWKEELSKIAENGGSAHFDFGVANQKDVETTVLDLFHRNRKDLLAEAIGYDGFGASRVTCSNENRNDDLSVLCRVEKVTHRIEQDDDEWEHRVDQDERTEVSYFEDAYSVYVEYNLNGKKIYNSSSEDVPEEVITVAVESEVTKFLIGFSCFGREWNDFENTVYIPAARTGIMARARLFRPRRDQPRHTRFLVVYRTQQEVSIFKFARSDSELCCFDDYANVLLLNETTSRADKYSRRQNWTRQD